MRGAVRPDPRPPELDEEERRRVRRKLVAALQAGGIVFLAVAALGLVPRWLADSHPALAHAAAVAAWILAPLLGLALLVVAALRLRR